LQVEMLRMNLLSGKESVDVKGFINGSRLS